MQKNFSCTFSKKIYFFNFKFTEAKFLHNCFWCNLIVYNIIKDINRKIVNFTYNCLYVGPFKVVIVL